MVKWLAEISVAPEESQNFYHFHDNRVLPPGVDQEKAKAEGALSISILDAQVDRDTRLTVASGLYAFSAAECGTWLAQWTAGHPRCEALHWHGCSSCYCSGIDMLLPNASNSFCGREAAVLSVTCMLAHAQAGGTGRSSSSWSSTSMLPSPRPRTTSRCPSLRSPTLSEATPTLVCSQHACRDAWSSFMASTH